MVRTSKQFFELMVDELVILSKNDPELRDAIKWLDEQAQKKGITFYDIVLQVMLTDDVDKRANKWLKEKLLDQNKTNKVNDGGVTTSIRQKTQHGKATSKTSKMKRSSWPRPFQAHKKTSVKLLGGVSERCPRCGVVKNPKWPCWNCGYKK